MGSNVTEHIIALAFIFATIYGLAYLYAQAEQEAFPVGNLQDTEGRFISAPETGLGTSITQYLIDYLLELVSIFSPFILLKYLLYTIMPRDLFDIFNLFILRPTGWIISWIWLEYVIGIIRGLDWSA